MKQFSKLLPGSASFITNGSPAVVEIHLVDPEVWPDIIDDHHVYNKPDQDPLLLTADVVTDLLVDLDEDPAVVSWRVL